MQKHKKKYVKREAAQTHIELCENWQKSTSTRLASQQAAKTRKWWWEGNVVETNIDQLERCLSWWECRISHWGNFNLKVRVSLKLFYDVFEINELVFSILFVGFFLF